jgi:uncharacterized protein YhbP (UPF0306 family)
VNAAREALEQYVAAGMLMQVATVSASGDPAVCHVWYHAVFRPDQLYFMSRRDRAHSANLRDDPRVAGGIVTIPLSGLGQVVRGVTFKGRARELDIAATAEITAFTRRWPGARNALDGQKPSNPDTSSRLYEITVSEWVLFDEEGFRGSPRRVVLAESGD